MSLRRLEANCGPAPGIMPRAGERRLARRRLRDEVPRRDALDTSHGLGSRLMIGVITPRRPSDAQLRQMATVSKRL